MLVDTTHPHTLTARANLAHWTGEAERAAETGYGIFHLHLVCTAGRGKGRLLAWCLSRMT